MPCAVSVGTIVPMVPTKTCRSTTSIRNEEWLSVMRAGTSKKSTKSTKELEPPKVYPVAGFVTYNWPKSALGNVIYGAKQDELTLTKRDRDKLNLAQRIGNRRGFLVVLACPRCGTVVQTYRAHDLDDGLAAKCPSFDCKKVWLRADED